MKYHNIKKITDYISSGIKTHHKKLIGLECEHIITDKNDNPVLFYGDNGIEHILIEFSVFYPEKTYSDGYLVGLNNSKVFITLEPAAQIEVSIVPFEDLYEIKEIYLEFKNQITEILNKYGYKLQNIGYHPSAKADDLPLIPKERYRLMDKYFISKGYHPRYMMRGSASVQINIDYFSEKDFAQKFRLANLLSPLFYLVTDNSPVFEGKRNFGFCSRAFAWENVDNSRCGFYDFETFKEYAEWIYSTEPIFICKDNNDMFCQYNTNEEIFNTVELSNDDISHIMSMVFPNVRVKKFIEIRAGDSMPIEYMMSYAALIKGLFYNSTSLEQLNSMFDFVEISDMYAQLKLIRERGFNCDYYGFDMKSTIKTLFKCAESGLNKSEILLLEPLKQLSLNFLTLKQISEPEEAIK